jgi:hypothetical protein
MSGEFYSEFMEFFRKSHKAIRNTKAFKENADKKETVYFDLVSGALIREGNSAKLEMTLGEILTLIDMDELDRIDAVLDILEMNSDIEVTTDSDGNIITEEK